ncbi:MAG: hypothetical protein RIT81_05765 [Deltaproteobacteria bacterium]
MSRTYRALLFALLASPGLIPLVAPYLPFQDWPGHLGVIGALIHLDDPAANIRELLEFKGWFGPNRALYWMGTLFGRVLGPMLGGQLLLALVMGSLGPAMLWLCRAAGTDERVALLALPLALGRHLYCGFVLNAAGLTFLVLAIAAYFDVLRRPELKPTLRLAAVLFLIPFFHGFFHLVSVGLIAWCILLALVQRRWRAALAGVVTSALSFVALVPQLSSIGGDPNAPSLYTAVTTAAANADRSRLGVELWEWLFASYRYSAVDDWFQGIWIAMLVMLLLVAVAFERRHFFTGLRWYLFFMAGVTAVMFWWLPSYIGPPLNWWGGNLRLPIVIAALLVPTVGLVGQMRAQNFIRVAAAFSVLVLLVAAADLVRFSYGEMDGLTEVIEVMPPGKKISSIHYTPREVHEYPGEPHGYVGNYYTLVKGGVTPHDLFEVKDIPFARKQRLPSPPWGSGGGFRFNLHAPAFDGFLVRVAPNAPDAPFRKDDPRVTLVKSAGNWRYYRRNTP